MMTVTPLLTLESNRGQQHMSAMIQSLFAHQAWADSAILKAVADQEGAYADEEIRKLLHHMAVVQRFFLSLAQARPFDMERERQVPAAAADLERLFRGAHEDGAAYTAALTDEQLSRRLNFPQMPDFHPQVRDALIQVAMHSEHHRAQIAMRLRAMGAKPPVTDYIMWVRSSAAL